MLQVETEEPRNANQSIILLEFKNINGRDIRQKGGKIISQNISEDFPPATAENFAFRFVQRK